MCRLYEPFLSWEQTKQRTTPTGAIPLGGNEALVVFSLFLHVRVAIMFKVCITDKVNEQGLLVKLEQNLTV